MRTLEEIRKAHPDHLLAKFFGRRHYWRAEASRIAWQMGLDTSPPLRILDLGCGLGYFVAVCRGLGHNADGVDAPDEVAREAAWASAVPFRPCLIQSFIPLPEDLQGYDLVTMFGVSLRHGPEQYWGADAYRFLGNDIRSRLKPGGRWVLRPNRATAQHVSLMHLLDVKWWRRCLREATVEVDTTEGQVAIRWETAR